MGCPMVPRVACAGATHSVLVRLVPRPPPPPPRGSFSGLSLRALSRAAGLAARGPKALAAGAACAAPIARTR